MGYTDSRFTKVMLKPSPSLLYNNLTATTSGLSYIHQKQVITVPSVPKDAAAVADTKQVDTQETGTVHTVRCCKAGNVTLLVIAGEGGVQIWDSTGMQLFYHWRLPANQQAESITTGSYARGISSNITADGTVQLCVGFSTGDIYVYNIAQGPIIKPGPVLRHHKTPITALSSAHQCRQGNWAEDLACRLVSCDELGNIAVWEATDANTYKVIKTIEGDGMPCSSLAVRSNFAICARLDGKVRIYGMMDGKIRSEIVAHSRWLSAMDIHPTEDIIATASEDATMNVWQLPIAGNKAAVLLSVCWLNSMLTGVAFCGEDHKDVAVTAYDTDELRIWRRS